MKPQSYISNKDPEEVVDKGEMTEADSTQLNPEELSKLKAFLQTSKMEHFAHWCSKVNH